MYLEASVVRQPNPIQGGLFFLREEAFREHSGASSVVSKLRVSERTLHGSGCCWDKRNVGPDFFGPPQPIWWEGACQPVLLMPITKQARLGPCFARRWTAGSGRASAPFSSLPFALMPPSCGAWQVTQLNPITASGISFPSSTGKAPAWNFT